MVVEAAWHWEEVRYVRRDVLVEEYLAGQRLRRRRLHDVVVAKCLHLVEMSRLNHAIDLWTGIAVSADPTNIFLDVNLETEQ
jgi:hypothetical protein